MTTATVTLAEIAREKGMNPKNARRFARAHRDDMPKCIGEGWVFALKDKKRVIDLLDSRKAAPAPKKTVKAKVAKKPAKKAATKKPAPKKAAKEKPVVTEAPAADAA